MRVVVRRYASDQTHMADVEKTDARVMFGVPYRHPPEDTKALCGCTISNGVVMQEGCKVRCHACRAINRREERRLGEGGDQDASTEQAQGA